ncbi:unnamed protein product [Ranitomeya imitator]|uniref:Ig-like domain-containing protein n=1 Tax=Ranitomeya imitator TaxID=111125 RepID=A0ABN9KS24_9NEOB|nr:unnamed protein product [Ranitomeya imitator]
MDYGVGQNDPTAYYRRMMVSVELGIWILWRDCDDPDSRLYLCVPGDTVTISCTASTGIRVPDRFSGVSDGSPYTSYKLTIRGATEDDAADYYCQQSVQYPLTQSAATCPPQNPHQDSPKTQPVLKRNEDGTQNCKKNGETKVAELARLLRANSANGKKDTQSSWSAETKHLRYVSKV